MMRLDLELVARNLYPTRAKAAAAIRSGLVSVDGLVVVKNSFIVPQGAEITSKPLPYVSGRGMLKLGCALDEFHIDVSGFSCLDVGSSTGGFSEVLLNRGALKVIAVDVGTNQLVSEIKNNPRVVSLERTDIRDLTPICPVDLVVIDVSFISLKNIIASLSKWQTNQIIALIKPQFEVSSQVAARCKGVIRNPEIHNQVIDDVVAEFSRFGFENRGLVESPVKGGSGNTEFLGLFIKRA